MRKVFISIALTGALTAVGAPDGGETAVSLNEIVVSANRHIGDERIESMPVFTITADRIAQINPQSAADILTADGMLTVQKSQFGGGSPSIRGFESSRVLLLVDGVRMNNLIYRAGHLQNIITLDPAAISSVDILYGPASVVYGSDALGGAIAFRTKNPETSKNGVLFKGSAFTRYGSVNNESSWHLDFNIAGPRIASFTSLSFSRFGDLKSGRTSNPFMKDDSYIHRQFSVVHADGKDVLVPNPRYWHQLESGYRQYDLMQKFLIRQSERIRHLFNFQFSNSGDIPRYDRLTDMKKGKPKFAQWYYGPQTRLLAAYTLTLDNYLGADVASATISYQNVKESRHNRKLDDPWLGNRNERVNIVGLTTEWLKNFGPHSLRAGIDAALQFLKSTANSVDINTGQRKNLDTRYPDGHNHMHNVDLFAMHRWSIDSRWALNDGIRVGFSSLRSTFISDEFFPFLAHNVGTVRQDNPTYSASIGVTFRPRNEWLLGFDLSTGYRVPNIDDIAKVFDSQPGMVVMPNPDIKPEKTVSANLSAAFVKNDVFEAEASAFGTYMFDAIALAPALFDGKDKVEYDGELSDVFSSRNNRLAYVFGASLNATLRLSGHFKADGAVSYAYGNILGRNGEKRMPLDHVAPLFGRLGISYNSGNDRITGEFFTLFNGRKPLSRYNLNGEDNIQYATVKGLDGDGLPAWFTLNLHVSYRPHPAVTLQGGVDNILDTEYRTFASGINAPGRNFFAAIRATF